MKRIYTPAEPKKILIVDDDRVVASIYQKRFENERYDVEIAGTGEQALRMLEAGPADLVVLDLSLPGMNGAELLSAIRSQAGAEKLPVIVFSNAYGPGRLQTASEAGATRCVRKSDCTPRQMVAVVREVLAASRAAGGATVGEGFSDVRSGSVSAANLLGAHGDEAEAEEFEMEYQARVVREFFARAPHKLARLRMGHHAFTSTQKEELRLREVSEMRRQARSLAGAAGVGGFRKIAELAHALEALLVELHAKPARITPSVARTVAQAIDTLASLFDQATSPPPEASAPPRILIVDDEVISRETICSALQQANLRAVTVDDSLAAERLLEQEQFDLIFLDVEMPGESGFDLCLKIREMTMNHATPVVFVTAHSDFGSRAQSTLSGGNDFIAKPFLLAELAVKALTWLFKESPQPLSTATAQHNSPVGMDNNQSSAGQSQSVEKSEPVLLNKSK